MKLSEMAQRFAELNPDLLRDICGGFYVETDELTFSHGKLTKGGIKKKHYKFGVVKDG